MKFTPNIGGFTVCEEGLIQTQIVDRVGVITLDRPKALNALNAAMIHAMHRTLTAWEALPLAAVVIRSSGQNAFCAGGDIKEVQRQVLQGNAGLSDDFFSTEYKLNSRIASYPVPVVSLIKGLCMGGGLGLSIHGNFRLVTETTTMAMPETAIGFFPDVGASFFLSRLPGAIGMYLGLTGHRMDCRDALYCGLATHYLSSEAIEAMVDRLASAGGQPVAQVIAAACDQPAPSNGHLAKHRPEIDWCFGAGSLHDIEARLQETNTEWSHNVSTRLRAVSPQSLETTFDLLSHGSQRSLEECLDMELLAARTVIRSDDFAEGVRAVLVDKDNEPAWSTAPALPVARHLTPKEPSIAPV